MHQAREVPLERSVRAASVCSLPPQQGKWNVSLEFLSPCFGELNQNQGIENTPKHKHINQL